MHLNMVVKMIHFIMCILQKILELPYAATVAKKKKKSKRNNGIQKTVEQHFFFFFWPHPWHVEVPGPVIQPVTAATQAAAVTTQDS